MTPRSVVLVGFMASGKSEVGRELARRLGWTHADLDNEIEETSGLSIEELFATRGEPGFRAVESEVSGQVVGRERTVVSTGGGWVTHPRAIADLPSGALTIWLRVSPEEVLRRLHAEPDQRPRPLLRVENPHARILELMRAREPLYAAAEITIETDGRSIAEIVDLIQETIASGNPASTPPDRTMQHGS